MLVQCGMFMVSRDGQCQPFGENTQGFDFDYRFTISHSATDGKRRFDFNLNEMALSLTRDETQSKMIRYLNIALETLSDNDMIVHKAVVIKSQTGFRT